MAVRKRDVIGSVDQVSTKSEAESSARKKPVATKVRWQDSNAGKIVMGALCSVVVIAAVIQIRSYFQQGVPGDPNTITYIDAQTNQPFAHTNVIGETLPIVTPAGTQTGYPAVPCYWTAAGEIKKNPTWVLMNSYVGKPGPTICPDCGRLVDPNRPIPPRPTDSPPPTREELLHAIPNPARRS